ncbi:MAG: NAD(P)-dependent alcohol dehydrogenase [Candidatus Viridilinea halotolerans]|uniref:NAD(P)-dependent alcohol dehydrogenase n=1 Tax=Candidatus Viridilinea halotolerans TaxID=2491704 RepID=A0A426TXV1_9CHLR|nr:MAG: NAD(P)-dependent alcohol dehydrogenase [Candidatus Viridilinea halotolerans]
MKAAICRAYGPPEVLQVCDIQQPVPKHHEVSIKIHTAAVTASDAIVRGFKLARWSPMGLGMGLALGFTRPRNPILGNILAGEVEAVGRHVSRFRVGDQVYAFTMLRFGAYAEYTCLPESVVIASKPQNLSFEEAAAIPYGGLIALHFLRKARVAAGQKVLIYGASGAIGSTAVQLARYFGADVTGVCSTANMAWVQALGAETVIDYTQEDFTKRDERYDLILNAVGKRKARLACQRSLTPQGKHVTVDDGNPKIRTEGLLCLNEVIGAGKLKPVIDRVYPLDQIAEAHRYVDQGHKKGNVVITM